MNILQKLSAQDLPHLRMKDVRRALISAGINPTQAQLDQMMVLGDAYKTFDKRGQLEFKEFLRIYTHLAHQQSLPRLPAQLVPRRTQLHGHAQARGDVAVPGLPRWHCSGRQPHARRGQCGARTRPTHCAARRRLKARRCPT